MTSKRDDEIESGEISSKLIAEIFDIFGKTFAFLRVESAGVDNGTDSVVPNTDWVANNGVSSGNIVVVGMGRGDSEN